MMRSVFNSFAVLFSGLIAASVLNFIAIALIAKGLSVESFGIFSLITSYFVIIDKLVNFQSWQALVKYGVKVKEVEVDIFKLTSFCFSIDLITAVIGFLASITLLPILALYMSWGGEILDIAYIYSITMMFKFYSFSFGLFRIYDKVSLQAKVNLISALVKLLCVIACYFLGYNDLIHYVISWLIGDILLSLLTTVMGLYTLKDKFGTIKIFQYGILFEREKINFVGWTNFSSLIDLPAKELDVMMVGLLTGEKNAGLYKLTKQAMNMVARLVSPLYQVVYPLQVNLIDKKQTSEVMKFTRNISLSILSVSCVGFVFVIILTPYLVEGFFVEGYFQLKELLLIGLSVKLLDIIFTPYHSLFIAFGFVKENAKILILCNTLLLVLMYLSLKYFNLDFMIYSMMIQSFMTFAFKIRYINNVNNQARY